MKTRLILGIVFALHLGGCGMEGMGAYNEGVKYAGAGKLDEAEKQFKIALEQNPGFAEAHMNLGYTYLNRNQLEGAEASTKKAIGIFERTRKTFIKGATWEESLSIAYNNLGVIEIKQAMKAQSEQNGEQAKARWEQAMRDFEKAGALDPSNAQAQGNIARFEDAY